ncbi:porin [Paraburkholderia tuberum]|uniref:Outer membrane protein (Porin) n=1 Tax=Paraburkholderia tuberum TaxID=157910 RepID=A0A1H1KH46_9BURK|nr:porin [Paraburkholderia tuberum]SDR61566.1 Outer membrane protein (porin) [Paraburkholderia tuberum]
MKVKKLAIGAAMLLSVTGAYAESSVTLYGIMDTGIEFYNHAKTGGSVYGMPALTGELPSRWGLKGVEDLGGGLKAVFNLESGFAPGTGGLNYGGRLFGRQANVGLSNRFGTVLFGRQSNMTYYSVVNADILGPALIGLASFDPYLANARSDNAIGYMGKFGSVTIGATYSFGRDSATVPGPGGTGCAGQVPGNFQACKQVTAMVMYDTANYGASVSFDQMRGGASTDFGPLVSSSDKDTHIQATAYYNFSHGKFAGGWIHHNVDVGRSYHTDLYFLNGTYLPTPFLALDLVGAHFNVSNPSNIGGVIENGSIVPGSVAPATSNSTMITARATYFLSKRTSVYGMLGYMINSRNGAVALTGGGTVQTGANQTGGMVGIQHKF